MMPLLKTIFRDLVEFSVNFKTPYSAATGPKELRISLKLHQIAFYSILESKNHSVILRALIYSKEFNQLILISFNPLLTVF